MVNNNKKGFFKRAFSATEPQEPSNTYSTIVIPPRTDVGEITTDKALSLPVVYRSVELISNGISQLGIDVFRAGEQIDTPMIVRRPDRDRTQYAFLKRAATDLALTGNAYMLVLKNSAGVAEQLKVLSPRAVRIDRTSTGVKRYTYNNKVYADWDYWFKTGDIIHLRKSEFDGHDYGVGPLQACKEQIKNAIQLRDFPSNWHKDNGIPPGILTVPGELDPEEAAAYRATWMKNVAEGDVQLLHGGMKFEPFLLSASDIEFLGSLNNSDLQIARMFGIDPAMMSIPVEGTSLTYANKQELNVHFIQTCLMQYIKEIESALTDVLPRGQEARFNVEDFLRAYQATPDTAVTPVPTNQPKEPANADAA